MTAPPTAPGARVLVLAGRGRYEDPWHDTAATSHRVARALETDPAGTVGEVVVRGTFPDALDDVAGFDLLVVNCSTPPDGPQGRGGSDEEWTGFHAALRAYARAGSPVLGVHQATMAFSESPDWEQILGGRWVHGTSMHPPIGDAVFTLVGADAVGSGEAHPVVAALTGAGVTSITAFDERYSRMRVAGTVEVLARHELDGTEEPVVWVNTAGGLRVVCDALGHGVRSYDSPSRVALLRAEVAWLLGAQAMTHA